MRIDRDSREDSHCGVFAEVEVADGPNSLWTNEWNVARENEKMFGRREVICGEVLLDLLDGVAGSALLVLPDEVRASVLRGGAATHQTVSRFRHGSGQELVRLGHTDARSRCRPAMSEAARAWHPRYDDCFGRTVSALR